MLPKSLWLLCLTAIGAQGKTTTTSNEFYSRTFSTLSSASSTNAFTGSKYTYLKGTTQSTLHSSSHNATTSTSNKDSQITVSSTTHSLTYIGGKTRTGNETSTATESSARAQNTVPCNGFPEFCNRQYSNITNVCAHNSAFVVPNNAGSNQALPVVDQLNDGIRMLQGETHWVNNTIMNCHTSCELLNAGTWQSELEVAAAWLARNPYDVLTWLIVNSDFTKVENYVPAIQNSGIARYLYTPKYIPQRKDQWPTLAEMILSGQRLVMFMDYNANQTSVPYILDEFTHMWETPFSPTNQSFPCDVQRPPHLADPKQQDKARDDFMYLANHNLNTAVDLRALLGSGAAQKEILIPNTAELNQTNGQYNQFGQLGAMSLNCTRDWDRPPNFLLVDYYNYGDPKQGSVFEVAARANGVKYQYGHCCGLQRSRASNVQRPASLVLALVACVLLMIW